MTNSNSEAILLLQIDILKKYLELKIENPKQEMETIQHWVKRIFEHLLNKNILTEEEIALLHDKTYSKETFDIRLPLLVDDLKSTEDSKGYDRYWQERIGGYYICSQWQIPKGKTHEANSKYEAYIKYWLSKVFPDYIEYGLDRIYYV